MNIWNRKELSLRNIKGLLNKKRTSLDRTNSLKVVILTTTRNIEKINLQRKISGHNSIMKSN